ncbi:MAG: hypothetical protein ACOCSM_00680 [Bacillota bacterium]
MAYEIISTLKHPIFESKKGPFISIYQRTHKDPSKNEEDSIRFKNRLKDARKQLEEQFPDVDPKTHLASLEALENDTPFWNHTQEGLAVFSNPDHTVVFLFTQPVRDIAMVSNALYTLPLTRVFQTLDEYHVLALSKDRFRLFTGNRDKVDEVKFDDSIPTTKEEVLGELDTENKVTYGSYGAQGGAQYHGHEDTKDVEKVDMIRFFKHVDDFVYENYTKTSDAPLIPWALPEYQGIFREHSRNDYLLEDGVRKSINDLDEDTVRDTTWSIIEPRYEKTVNDLVDRYNQAVFNGLGGDVLKDLFDAAFEGRIETLLVEEGRFIPGHLDSENQPVIYEKASLKTHDLLDTLAKEVENKGGEIRVLSEEKMPTTTGVAAIYRY